MCDPEHLDPGVYVAICATLSAGSITMTQAVDGEVGLLMLTI
jgi:hypothetical protein